MANNPTLPKKAGGELGQSGTIIYGGIISNEEYNRELTGIRGNHIFEIMRRSDSTVSAALKIVKLPLLSASWDLEAAKDPDGNVTDQDDYIARFVKRELMQRAVNFDHFLKTATTHFDFGFSVFEKVFEVTEFEGKVRIGLAKLGFRKQVSIIRWETQDHQPGVTQQINGDMISIPREKLAVFTHDKEGDNYAGISLLRTIFKDWDIKDKLTLVNAIAQEKQGVGVPYAQAKENQTPSPEDEMSAEQWLKNFRANESAFVKVPSTMEVGMMDMKGNSTKEIIPTLNYHDGRIMTGVLARFMELGGASGSGSQSLASDLSSVFMKSEEAAAKEIASVITEDIIKQICDLNFSDLPNGYPKLTFGSIADDDTKMLAESVASLMTAGALTPDIDLENSLRERLSLPEKEADDVGEPTGKTTTKSKAKPNDTTVDDTSVTNPKDQTNASVIAEARRQREKLYKALMEG